MIHEVYEQFRDSGFRFQEMIVALLTAREFPANEAARLR